MRCNVSYGRKSISTEGKEFDFVHMKRRVSARPVDRGLHRLSRDIKLWDCLVRNRGLQIV